VPLTTGGLISVRPVCAMEMSGNYKAVARHFRLDDLFTCLER
jgi:hypothetical protein